MANKYWVGAGATTGWTITGPTNWSDTDGGANNAAVPGVGDVCIFNGNSGSGTATIASGITHQKLITTGYTGTISHGAFTLSLNTAAVDTLIIDAGMTYTPTTSTSIIALIHTSGTADLTVNGKRLGGLTINGVGGTTRQLDAMRVDINPLSALTLTNGIYNANGFAVTASAVAFSNSNTRSLILGGGDWTIGGSATAGANIWNASTVTLLTFTKGASNIIVPSNSLGGTRIFAGGGLTYNNLTIASNSGNGAIVIQGANTFNALAVGAGNLMELPASTTTITTAPAWVGTATQPILVDCVSIGSTATISIASGTMTLAFGGLRDITGSGGATFVATDTFDFGNNTGWAITAPAAALTAADIRAAVGLASANLDTQLDALPTANESADALLDRAAGIETGLTVRQGFRLWAAALLGKATGFDTGSVVYRDTGDTKNRISSAVTAAGRGAPTLDAS